MSKRALCVGINDYPYDGSDLNGCVNDAKAWAAVLVEHYGFPKTDVKVILDTEATKKKIIEGLKWLLKGGKKGDVLVFTNSSHGSYVADQGGDEKYDEILCPYDVDSQGGELRDDELREMFSGIKNGVSLTIISDSCFSGTVTRARVQDNLPGMLRVPDDRRVRFLSPALRGEPVLANPWKARANSREKYPESGMKEILLSGCSDREYSYDAWIEGTYHGAMTYHALKAIQEADYKLTYAQLHERLLYLLNEAEYPQTPQLEGKRENKRRQVFS